MYQLHEASYPTPKIESTLFSPIHRMAGPNQRLSQPSIVISAQAIESAKSGGGPAYASAAMQPLAPSSAAQWGDAQSQFQICSNQVCGPFVGNCGAQCMNFASPMCNNSTLVNCMPTSAQTTQEIRQGTGWGGGASAARAAMAGTGCPTTAGGWGAANSAFCGCLNSVCTNKKFAPSQARCEAACLDTNFSQCNDTNILKCMTGQNICPAAARQIMQAQDGTCALNPSFCGAAGAGCSYNTT